MTPRWTRRQVMGARRAVNADPEVRRAAHVRLDATGDRRRRAGRGGRRQRVSMKEPVKGDTYPVLSAEKALDAAERAGRRGRTTGALRHRRLRQRRAASGPRRPAPCGRRPALRSGRDGEEAGRDGRGRGVRAGPALRCGRRQALVPSWLFEVRAPGARDGVTVTYPAVEPEYRDHRGPRRAVPGPVRRTGPGARGAAGREGEGYTTADGESDRELHGRGVRRLQDAKAEERTGKVTVTVTETPHPDKVCILIAKEYERTVPLDEPLGERTVVGTDGEEILSTSRARGCRPPSGGRSDRRNEGGGPGRIPGHRPSHVRRRAAPGPSAEGVAAGAGARRVRVVDREALLLDGVHEVDASRHRPGTGRSCGR